MPPEPIKINDHTLWENYCFEIEIETRELIESIVTSERVHIS